MTEWATKVLENVPRHSDSQGYEPEYILEADADAAIARMGAGDGLVERAEAALEGVTGDAWRIHRVASLNVETTDGRSVASCGGYGDNQRIEAVSRENAANARFIAFTRQWVPEALAHIAVLTAKIEELRAERDRRAEMHECAMSERDDATLYADEQKARAEAAEAEAAVLKAQVAEKDEQLVSVLRRETATYERHDAKMEAADARAERDALRAKVARLEGAGNERPDAPAHIVEYTNYRGETARRCIIPIRMWWGSNDWHPEEQWMLTAWDLDKNASRDFAWQDMRPVQNGATSAARAALTDGGKDE